MAPSSQMEVASLTSGMALASSALRTASALGSFMSAVLAEEPVAQDPGYAGEPQTVNLYQCGGSLI